MVLLALSCHTAVFLWQLVLFALARVVLFVLVALSPLAHDFILRALERSSLAWSVRSQTIQTMSQLLNKKNMD